MKIMKKQEIILRNRKFAKKIFYSPMPDICIQDRGLKGFFHLGF